MKPLIGLTPTPQLLEQEHGTFRRHALSDNYSLAIEAAGGIPVMLPAHFDDVTAMLDRLDGVVITGGGDIEPAEYGQDVYAKTAEVDEERDRFEKRIVNEVVQRDLPLLGICRGLQMLNVALGGTLHQDLDDLKEGSVEHRQQSLKIHHEQTFQKAEIAPGEHKLAKIVPSGSIDINSFHHQGIELLSDELVATAHTEDGLIEAVEHPGMSFGIAVQWHPEMLASAHREHAGIFEAFVDAATAYQRKKENNA